MAKNQKLPIARALDIGFGFTKFTKSHLLPNLNVDVGVFQSYAATDWRDSKGPVGDFLVLAIEVNGAHYLVGDDVNKVSGGNPLRLLTDEFFTSPQYMALARGAMAYMAIPADGVIDVLTVGLPLTVFRDKRLRNSIKERLSGEHKISGLAGGASRTIKVISTILVPQVQGSLYALAADLPEAKRETIEDERNLTIDVGYGTLLWLTSDGLTPLPARSDGSMGGASAVLDAMMTSISPRSVGNVSVTERLDKAIRENQETFKVAGAPVGIGEHRGAMEAVVSENMTRLLRSVGNTDDIDNVFLTGGGAHLYAEAVRRAFPNQVINGAQGTQFTNVRGFQMISEGLLDD